jgi:hypothetical protein
MTKEAEKVMGPVDYVVVLFPGNKFTGKIAPELERLQKNGTIRVIDLVFIMKDERGNTLFTEAKNLSGADGEAFKSFSSHLGDWLSEEDIHAIGATLPLNCSAAAILFENTWALAFKKSLLDADARLLTQGRIPHEQVLQVMKDRIYI